MYQIIFRCNFPSFNLFALVISKFTMFQHLLLFFHFLYFFLVRFNLFLIIHRFDTYLKWTWLSGRIRRFWLNFSNLRQFAFSIIFVLGFRKTIIDNICIPYLLKVIKDHRFGKFLKINIKVTWFYSHHNCIDLFLMNY